MKWYGIMEYIYKCNIKLFELLLVGNLLQPTYCILDKYSNSVTKLK